jgi:hypothetical protein
MKKCMVLAILLPALTSSFVAAQNFELQGPPCQYGFPIGKGAPGDPEGVSWNGLGINPTPLFVGPGSTVDIDNGCGFPCFGLQYLRMFANGPEFVPANGPAPQPFTNANEVYIPIPPSPGFIMSVWLCWDFYNCEGGPTAGFNDGMMIDVLDANNQQMAVLAYADTFSPLGPLIDGMGAAGPAPAVCPSLCPGVDLSTAVPGPEFISGVTLPIGAVWLRVSVWNGGDNFNSSHGVVDDIIFQPGGPPCQLVIQGFPSPIGWQIDVNNLNCTPNTAYFTCLTPNAGLFPGGWFFGIDPLLSTVAAQLGFGFPPFQGILDATGSSFWSITIPAPIGINMYGVTVEHVGWMPVGATPPTVGGI